MQRTMLLGVPVDPVTAAQAVSRIRAYLKGEEAHHVMTPNSEMIVEAQRNGAFKALLNRTSLNLPDSAGLLWAARHTKQHLPERVTGVDTVATLCAQLTEDEPVFLLGAAPGVAERAAAALAARNPRLRVAGTYAGAPKDEDASGIVARINAAKPALLLVAFGAPAQDVWIDKHLSHMPSVKVAMGVGGTFDFLAGVQKRAPAVMRDLHLEWLWRFVRQPHRLPRIIRATVTFPWMILTRGSRGAVR